MSTITVRRGTIVQTDFGTGAVVAVTKDWLIHMNEEGREVCVYIPDNWICVPAQFDGTVDAPDEPVEIKH